MPGIRGSGNILQHSDEAENKSEYGNEKGVPTTLNYTIQGSHVVCIIGFDGPGLTTLPDHTVKVQRGLTPVLIPTPPSILSASAKMTGKPGSGQANRDGAFKVIEPALPMTVGASGNAANGVTSPVFPPPDLGNTLVLPFDPSGVRDVAVSVAGGTYASQALPTDVTLESAALRSYQFYQGIQTAQSLAIEDGTAVEVQTINLGGASQASSQVTIGRWVNPSSFIYSGFAFQPAASVHFAYGGSGYAAYLSDVLTGTVSYNRASATTSTNQLRALGTLTSSIFDINFTQLPRIATPCTVAAELHAELYAK